jgi:Methyltransferase domain
MAGLLISNRTSNGSDGKKSYGSVFEIIKVHWMNLSAFCITTCFVGYNFHVSRQMIVPQKTVESHKLSNSDVMFQQQLNPLGIPHGKAENLPSVLTDASDSHNVDKARNIYGGAGDKKHLGGFTELDLDGVSPAVWKHMLQFYGVHSVLDVGCGRGTSTSWFALHGCNPVMCVEGSHDAVEKSIFGSIQPESIVEHDFSRGPWWPEQTFDAAWAVEFLEHVGVNFHYNYVTAFRKVALIFVSSSRWGGWHHVEVHQDDWWIRKYESYGLKYDDKLTQEVRAVAQAESSWPDTDNRTVAPNGGKYNAQHVWLSMKVFINPVVAALPQHAHLFPEHGCFGGRNEDGSMQHKVCGTDPDSLESILPQSYWPLEPTIEQDEAWNDLIRRHITTTKKS